MVVRRAKPASRKGFIVFVTSQQVDQTRLPRPFYSQKQYDIVIKPSDTRPATCARCHFSFEFRVAFCLLVFRTVCMEEVEGKEGRESSSSRQASGLADAVMDSLLNPGLNARMKSMMNGSFVMLIVTLSLLALLTGGNGHVIALLGIRAFDPTIKVLSCCLFGAINWFLGELANIEPKKCQ